MKSGIFLIIGVISGFFAKPVVATVPPHAILGPRLLLSEESLRLTVDGSSGGFGETGGIAAALGGFVVRGALAPSAPSLPQDQIAPGLLLASAVFLAGFRIWDGLRIWSAAIPLDVQATDLPGLELPARRPFYGMPNVSTTSGLGVELNW